MSLNGIDIFFRWTLNCVIIYYMFNFFFFYFKNFMPLVPSSQPLPYTYIAEIQIQFLSLTLIVYLFLLETFMHISTRMIFV